MCGSGAGAAILTGVATSVNPRESKKPRMRRRIAARAFRFSTRPFNLSAFLLPTLNFQLSTSNYCCSGSRTRNVSMEVAFFVLASKSTIAPSRTHGPSATSKRAGMPVTNFFVTGLRSRPIDEM